MSDIQIDYNGKELTTVGGGQNVKLMTADAAVGDIVIQNKEQQHNDYVTVTTGEFGITTASIILGSTVLIKNSTYTVPINTLLSLSSEVDIMVTIDGKHAGVCVFGSGSIPNTVGIFNSGMVVDRNINVKMAGGDTKVIYITHI